MGTKLDDQVWPRAEQQVTEQKQENPLFHLNLGGWSSEPLPAVRSDRSPPRFPFDTSRTARDGRFQRPLPQRSSSIVLNRVLAPMGASTKRLDSVPWYGCYSAMHPALPVSD